MGHDDQKRFVLMTLNSFGLAVLHPRSWISSRGQESVLGEGANEGLLYVQTLWNWRLDRDRLCTCKSLAYHLYQDMNREE